MSIYILNKKSNMQKILVVEDDTSIASMYAFKLVHGGYTVKVAHNGEHGLAEAQSFDPDLILLDIRMPIMNGDKMLEVMRATEWGSSIRVIILTNISKDEAPSSLRFLQVDRYIVKAHQTPGQVLEIIEEILPPMASKIS
jgi:two-component system response regulator AdeR